jgi:hypothetical protein
MQGVLIRPSFVSTAESMMTGIMMGYAFHIKRDNGFTLDEWKQAVESFPALRLDASPVSATNPATDEVVTVDGRDGDVALLLDGDWVRVFRFFEDRASSKATPVAAGELQDPVLATAFALAGMLGANIFGDEGEEYKLP